MVPDVRAPPIGTHLPREGLASGPTTEPSDVDLHEPLRHRRAVLDVDVAGGRAWTATQPFRHERGVSVVSGHQHATRHSATEERRMERGQQTLHRRRLHPDHLTRVVRADLVIHRIEDNRDHLVFIRFHGVDKRPASVGKLALEEQCAASIAQRVVALEARGVGRALVLVAPDRLRDERVVRHLTQEQCAP